MSIETIKKRIDRHEWYRQGAAVKMFSISFPWSTCTRMKIGDETLGVSYDMMCFYQDVNMEFYFTKESLKAVALEYFSRQSRDPRFLERLMSDWSRERVQPFVDMIKTYRDHDLKFFNDQELFELYKYFKKFYLAVWDQSIFLDSFDYYSEYILDEILKREGRGLPKEPLDVLLHPPEISFLQRERLEMLTLAEDIIVDREKKKIVLATRDFSSLKDKAPDVASILLQHSQQYYWLQNDYASIKRLEPDYFLESLRDLLKHEERLAFEQEAGRFLKNFQQAKRYVIRKYDLSPSFLLITDFLARLGNFRDARKTYNQMANDFLHCFTKEWSRRYSIEPAVLEGLFFWEVEEFIGEIMRDSPTTLDETSVRKLADRAGNRPKAVFFWTSRPDEKDALHGARALHIKEYVLSHLQKAGEIRGRTAYPGLVRGVVKIIWDQRDFLKMRKGDILVAPNTRPEYAPIMKLAGAIVSDEGGLTCHSAIVSRELRIPCIVGTQTATIFLKDGDQVEIDAEKGVVKKL